eukprot:5063543-Pyramimonas_sp.AAC.1
MEHPRARVSCAPWGCQRDLCKLHGALRADRRDLVLQVIDLVYLLLHILLARWVFRWGLAAEL